MLIRCPECGNTVSDKAETCPHCGIKIAAAMPTPQPQYQNQPANNPAEQDEEKKQSKKVWIISFFIALVIFGVGLYFYNQAQAEKEQDAYEYAMQSTDPVVLQDYLSKYMDAPLEHRDSVTLRLTGLQQEDQAWQDALASGSRGALTQYIEQNPDSPHVGEAKNMIDSIDYAKADREYQTSQDITALQQYLTDHPDGRYADEVQEIIGNVKDTEVTPAELSFVKGVCRKFFQAINSKNAEKLVSTVSDVMTNFLNRSGATSDDVVSFMNKLYKDDITNMNWHLGDDFKATKVDDGMGGKNIQVQFSAVQKIDRTDPNKEKVGNYIISAEVTQDGHITKFNMKKKVAQ